MTIQAGGLRVAGLALAGVLAAAPAGADILYSQVVEPSGQNIGFGFYSSPVPRARRSFKHADDFTLSAPGIVQGVRWWGINEGAFSTGLANYDAWTIEFFASQSSPAGSTVGALIDRQTFLKADTSPTPTGRINPLNGEGEIMQQVTLGSEVSLAAGTHYWIAVSAHPISGSGDAWGWRDGVTVNGYSNVYSYATGLWTGFQDTDSAFELIGVPAPGGGAMALLALAAWARSRRR